MPKSWRMPRSIRRFRLRSGRKPSRCWFPRYDRAVPAMASSPRSSNAAPFWPSIFPLERSIATNCRTSWWSCERATLNAFYFGGEHIANTAFGLNDARGTRIAFEFASQPENLHVDAAVEDVLVHAGRCQQVLAVERSLGC